MLIQFDPKDPEYLGVEFVLREKVLPILEKYIPKKKTFFPSFKASKPSWIESVVRFVALSCPNEYAIFNPNIILNLDSRHIYIQVDHASEMQVSHGFLIEWFQKDQYSEPVVSIDRSDFVLENTDYSDNDLYVIKSYDQQIIVDSTFVNQVRDVTTSAPLAFKNIRFTRFYKGPIAFATLNSRESALVNLFSNLSKTVSGRILGPSKVNWGTNRNPELFTVLTNNSSLEFCGASGDFVGSSGKKLSFPIQEGQLPFQHDFVYLGRNIAIIGISYQRGPIRYYISNKQGVFEIVLEYGFSFVGLDNSNEIGIRTSKCNINATFDCKYFDLNSLENLSQDLIIDKVTWESMN
ncbi:MAG: hypothetical protein ACRCXZ_09290 [Patescibacteria group bacterium]